MDCPKCAEPMRTYERNGVSIDQCTGCRGIFLDRGELERLVDAEGDFYDARAGGSQSSPRSSDDYGRGSHGQGGQHGSGSRKKRKGGFLGELFD